MKTYVAERQIEYWTSRQIEQFFLQEGFECVAYPVSQSVEKHLPADFIFGTRGHLVKLFGFQYKVLYYNDADCWMINRAQHSTLANFPWIYYGLSDVRHVSHHRSALFALRIKSNNFSFRSRLSTRASSPYRRWWSFSLELLECRAGTCVSSAQHFGELLRPSNVDVPMQIVWEFADLFLIAPQAKRILHLVTGIDPEQKGWSQDGEV